MENFNDAISSLQLEVNKYSMKKPDMLEFNDIPSFNSNQKFQILSSTPGLKLEFNKFMVAFPFLLIVALYYFKPEFIMVDNPYEDVKRVNYGKLIMVVFIVSLVVYCVGNST